MRGLAAGNSISTAKAGIAPYLIGKIRPGDSQRVFDYFERQIASAAIENGVVITKAGEVYHCTGDLNALATIEELGDKLKGAQVTHNHPVGSANEYSFSDADIALFLKYDLERLRGIDERYVYELNRDAADLDFEMSNIGELEELNLGVINDAHKRIGLRALIEGFGYRRWARE